VRFRPCCHREASADQCPFWWWICDNSYCNSVLQALYACEPFRAFILSYPDQGPPNIPLGPPPPDPNAPPTPSSPVATRGDPFSDTTASGATPSSPPTKRSWTGLGSRKSVQAGQPTLSALASQPIPPPAPVVPPAQSQGQGQQAQLQQQYANIPPMSLFATIQTLFHHLSTSAPHPAPAPKTPAATAPGQAGAAFPGLTPVINASSLSQPSASLLPNASGLPPGPAWLASLPPQAATRGSGPNGAGTLGRGVVRPEELIRTIKRENALFRGQMQQDAHEFLGWVLNRIAEEVVELDKDGKFHFHLFLY
jgi:ubiquitin carboxyl-terminal hydrolase 9/13